MRRTTLLGSALAAGLLFTGTGTTLAQDATPGARNVPAPEDCMVEPRSIDEITAVLATPAPATPEEASASPEAFVLPEGEPADSETVSAIEATMHELLACTNAGDLRAVFALYTDEYFQEVFPTFGPLPQEDLDFLATPPVESVDVELMQALLEIRDVRVLSDGRVGAIVVTEDPRTAPEGEETRFVIFEEQDGRWLIDDIVFFELAGTPTP
jgi:hypothetical protein